MALTQEALAWSPAPQPAPLRAALQHSTADGKSSGGPARHVSGADFATCSHLDCATERVRAGSSVEAQCAVDSATQAAVSPEQHGMQLSPPAVPCGRPDEEGAAPACFAPNSRVLQGKDTGRQRSSAAGNNARIHPRCRYAEREPDFAALAQRFSALRPYVRGAPGGRGKIDFTDSAAARCANALWPCWSWNGLSSLAWRFETRMAGCKAGSKLGYRLVLLGSMLVRAWLCSDAWAFCPPAHFVNHSK